MKLKFSRQIFEESSNIKFHGNPSSGSELFYVNGLTHRPMGGQADRQTDEHDEAKSRFSVLRSRLN